MNGTIPTTPPLPSRPRRVPSGPNDSSRQQKTSASGPQRNKLFSCLPQTPKTPKVISDLQELLENFSDSNYSYPTFIDFKLPENRTLDHDTMVKYGITDKEGDNPYEVSLYKLRIQIELADVPQSKNEIDFLKTIYTYVATCKICHNGGSFESFQTVPDGTDIALARMAMVTQDKPIIPSPPRTPRTNTLGISFGQFGPQDIIDDYTRDGYERDGYGDGESVEQLPLSRRTSSRIDTANIGQICGGYCCDSSSTIPTIASNQLCNIL